jgi:hypothetical protein
VNASGCVGRWLCVDVLSGTTCMNRVSRSAPLRLPAPGAEGWESQLSEAAAANGSNAPKTNLAHVGAPRVDSGVHNKRCQHRPAQHAHHRGHREWTGGRVRQPLLSARTQWWRVLVARAHTYVVLPLARWHHNSCFAESSETPPFDCRKRWEGSQIWSFRPKQETAAGWRSIPIAVPPEP